MPKLIDVKSTIEEPLRFFLQYPTINRESLRRQYKTLDGYDGYFDPDKNVAFVKVETCVDEDVVETTLEEFTFEEFIRNRIDDEITISQALITRLYKENPNQLAYKKLLRAFIEKFDKLKNYPEYPESELLPEALISIVTHAMHLYRKMFMEPMEKEVKTLIHEEEKLIGKTGFVLRTKFGANISELNKMLISTEMIEPETKTAQWRRFFAGKYPDSKINWIGKPGELKYFIDQVACDKFIADPPKQRYKLLPSIFKLDGNDLEKGFNKNNNYCSKKVKASINDMLNSFSLRFL